MADHLKQAFEYFLAHKPELEQQYNGKVIVIRDGQVVGAYATEAEAVAVAAKQFELGTFLVQRVVPGDSATTQTFHTRVAFA